jgi:hypothetical protein
VRCGGAGNQAECSTPRSGDRLDGVQFGQSAGLHFDPRLSAKDVFPGEHRPFYSDRDIAHSLARRRVREAGMQCRRIIVGREGSSKWQMTASRTIRRAYRQS